MIRQSALQNYALTFLKIAQEQDQLLRYSQQLEDFLARLRQEPLFFHTLRDPLIPFRQKQAVLAQSLIDAGYDLYVANFLNLLLDEHQEQAYEKIIEDFLEAYDCASGVTRGTVRSALPLSEEDLAKLEAAFSKKLGLKVHLIQSIDPELLGGLSVMLGDKIYDNSLLQGLKSLLTALTGDQKNANWLKRQMHDSSATNLPANEVCRQDTSLQAEVSTVIPLTYDQQEALKNALKDRFGHQINLNNHIDTSLMGGMVVRIGDLVLDGSLKRHMEGINQQLEQGVNL
jgi:F-type H+-transporting ATPase subunit delta